MIGEGSNRHGERGIAMILVLFMVLVLSVLGSSLIFVSRTETLSSLNYKTMSQTRYGAESGVHAAANYLLHIYTPPGTGADPIGNYDMDASPVRYNGRPVVLSSDPDVASNYPIDAVRDAFIAAAQGDLAIANTAVGYTAQATLLSMRQFNDAITGLPSTVQTWQITGRGVTPGAASAQVEVSAILERREVPVYKYAAFATADGCAALDFAGGATTDSYDSRDPLVGGVPVLEQHSGNVGTNGGLEGAGNRTRIYGTLSSPRTGVGSCTDSNVTAFETSGGASVEGGMIQLPQALSFPTPPPIDPPPPLVSHSFGSGCPGGVSYCSAAPNGARFTPPSGASIVQLGNISMSGQQKLYLNAGIYEINSISMSGQSQLIVESGPVIIRVAGTGATAPINVQAAQSIVNTSYVASNLQFIYGGTGEVLLRGNAAFSALVYAPNAETSFTGQGSFYGAIVTKKVKATGGADIHYDRALENGGMTLGNPTLSAFTWRSF